MSQQTRPRICRAPARYLARPSVRSLRTADAWRPWASRKWSNCENSSTSAPSGLAPARGGVPTASVSATVRTMILLWLAPRSALTATVKCTWSDAKDQEMLSGWHVPPGQARGRSLAGGQRRSSRALASRPRRRPSVPTPNSSAPCSSPAGHHVRRCQNRGPPITRKPGPAVLLPPTSHQTSSCTADAIV